MIDDFSKLRFLTVCTKDELKLLEELIFELAIASNAICTSDVMTRDEKLTGLKQLNEINIRVINIVSQIRSGDSWSNKESTFDMIHNHVKRAPHVSHWVGNAIIRSLQTVNA